MERASDRQVLDSAHNPLPMRSMNGAMGGEGEIHEKPMNAGELEALILSAQRRYFGPAVTGQDDNRKQGDEILYGAVVRYFAGSSR